MQSIVGTGDLARNQRTMDDGGSDVTIHWSHALPRAPENVVRRERLLAVLDENAPLVVVQGPAGFGKTTLVAEWAHARTRCAGTIVWMDATHSTPQTFWSDLAAAFAESGIILDPIATSPFSAIHAAVQARSTELTLVLDRFDTVANHDIRERLHDLIVRRRWLRVIACVRRRGIFDSILWSDLAVNAIRAHDLAFTIDETAQLARVLGADMHDDDIRSLRDAGQGWPEPTRALALELARTHTRGADVGIIAGRVARDYLRQRVLPEIEADGRLSFIFATAVPDSVTEQIAQVLTGDAQSGRRLDRLESEGLISSTSESGEVVYRWPAAARTALREELRQRNPQDAAKLNTQLASWYFSRKLFGPALRYALTANNPDLAVRIVDDGWPELLKMHLQELDKAITVIPHALIVTHPQAAAIRDIRLSLSSQTDGLLLSLPEPLPNEPRKLEAIARSPQSRRAMSTATVMMIALRVRGRMAHAVRYADMVERIGRIGRFHQPNRIISQLPNDYLQVGITRGLADDLPGAIDILGFAYELAPHSESEHVAVDAAAKLALFHSLRGETKLAMSWLDRYARPYRKSDWMKRWVSLSGSIARTLTAIDRLDRPGATEAIAHVQNTARGEQSWSHFVTYTHARYALHWGDRVGALARLREERIRRAPWLLEGTTIRPLFDAAEADLLMALGQGNQVDNFWRDPTTTAPWMPPAPDSLCLLVRPNERFVPQHSGWVARALITLRPS